jgi:hypothetical protein
MTSDMRGNSMWFGNTVLAVTMLMELSTTKGALFLVRER